MPVWRHGGDCIIGQWANYTHNPIRAVNCRQLDIASIIHEIDLFTIVSEIIGETWFTPNLIFPGVLFNLSHAPDKFPIPAAKPPR